MKHIKEFEDFINEEIFLNYTDKIVGYQFKKFTESYLKLNKNNKIKKDKDGNTYGFREGEKTAHWKYDDNTWKLYSDLSNNLVLGLINSFNLIAKGHPWS